MSSIKERAEQLAKDILLPWEVKQTYVANVTEMIEKALRDERERAAKIAENAFEPAHTYASENAHEYIIYDNGQRRAMQNIAAAIRKED